jgi:hypothetical protein
VEVFADIVEGAITAFRSDIGCFRQVAYFLIALSAPKMACFISRFDGGGTPVTVPLHVKLTPS